MPRASQAQVTMKGRLVSTKAFPVCCSLFNLIFANGPPAPQVTTDPSAKMAAKAFEVACTSCTPLNGLWTSELSPPACAVPQVTTDPSARMAANAWKVPCTCSTPLSWSWTSEISELPPPERERPQVTTNPSPSAKIAAKAPEVPWIFCTPVSWSWAAELFPPQVGSPQVKTDPSSRIAANAREVAWTCFTPLSWSWISELSPSLRQQRQHPKSQLIHPPGWQQMRRKFLAPAGDLWADVGLQSCLRNVYLAPQVTTDLSARIAANAQEVAWTCCTPFSWSCTSKLQPPLIGWPHVTIRSPPQHHNAKASCVAAISASCTTMAVRWSPSWTPAACGDSSGSSKRPAATTLKKPSWNNFCARIFRSPTLEDSGCESLSLRPLGRVTLTWSI